MIKPVLALVFALSLVACDERDARRDALDTGDKRAKAGAPREAIRAYESALDGTAKSADIHYKMAVLYDEKLKSPIDAIHHYDRYLELDPNGNRVKDARAARADCEKRLQLSFEKEGYMTTGEAARLRNESESLRKMITDLKNPKPPPPNRVADPNQADQVPPGARIHTVVHGDTLASLAMKYDNKRSYANHIRDANFNQLGGKDIIRIGEKLIIPEAPAKKRK